MPSSKELYPKPGYLPDMVMALAIFAIWPHRFCDLMISARVTRCSAGSLRLSAVSTIGIEQELQAGRFEHQPNCLPIRKDH
jgi:hypothetical protein